MLARAVERRKLRVERRDLEFVGSECVKAGSVGALRSS